MSTMTKAPQASGHGCTCGCSDCGGECCELECLVQPRFFCGQLLTDQDLNALLEWVKGKTALTRYRHGWGIVCGLDVSCSAEPGREGFVSVTPGYAIDCCGNDIIVCLEAQIDLSKYCLPEGDICAQWPAAQPNRDDNSTLSFGGFEVPRNEVQAIDLFIGYAETVSDAQNALARRACDAVEACEYTRTHEGYRLYAKKAEHCDQSVEKRALDWEAGYRRGLEDFFNAVRSDDPTRRLERLGRWADNHQLTSFCFAEDWLTELLKQGEINTRAINELTFWMAQDWRNHYLRCDCFECGPETGVPLARVWLRRVKKDNGRATCKVLYINPYPPYRRPVQQECWPVPSGNLGLARFVWQSVDNVSTELRNMGIDEISMEPFTFDGDTNLRDKLGSDPLSVPAPDRSDSASLVVYYCNDICNQKRVVRFDIGSRPKRNVGDAAALSADNQMLDLQRVSGIKAGYAQRLQDKGIMNIRDLAAASPETVREALSDLPVFPPPEKFINDAADLLKQLEAEN